MILALLLSHPALAWDSIGAIWPAAAFPLPYVVQSDLGTLSEVDGAYDDTADADALAAIQAAFDTWSAVQCADISFSYGGRIDSGTFNVADGQNEILFFTEGWPADSSLISAPGTTVSGTTIIDADIGLNGQNYAWSTDGDGRTRMDLQSSMTQEIGHMLGLWQSSAGDASLNPALDGNPDARSLAGDDLTGICALYPILTPGSAEQGEECVDTSDCSDGLACLADGATQYCAETCDLNNDQCAEGFACLDAGSGGSLCATSAGCGCAAAPSAGGAAAGGPAASGWLGLVGALGAWGRRRRRADWI